MRVYVLMSAAVMASLAAMPVYAQDAIWKLTPLTGDFNAATNWEPAMVPRGTAFFGTTSQTALFFSAATVVGGLTINDSLYTFLNTQPLDFDGAGIVGNAGSATINNSNVGTVPIMRFLNNSTAGSATINNNPGSLLLFGNTSTAGRATIANASTLSFSNDSTAGTTAATITNSGVLIFFDQQQGGRRYHREQLPAFLLWHQHGRERQYQQRRQAGIP
jgi:hypothetical protein